MSFIYRLQPEEGGTAEEVGKAGEGVKAGGQSRRARGQGTARGQGGKAHQERGEEGQPGALEAERLRHCNLCHKPRQ